MVREGFRRKISGKFRDIGFLATNALNDNNSSNINEDGTLVHAPNFDLLNSTSIKNAAGAAALSVPLIIGSSPVEAANGIKIPQFERMSKLADPEVLKNTELSDVDIHHLARNVYFEVVGDVNLNKWQEVGGQGFDSWLASTVTVLSRSIDAGFIRGSNYTIQSIIEMKNQYSWTNEPAKLNMVLDGNPTFEFIKSLLRSYNYDSQKGKYKTREEALRDMAKIAGISEQTKFYHHAEMINKRMPKFINEPGSYEAAEKKLRDKISSRLKNQFVRSPAFQSQINAELNKAKQLNLALNIETVKRDIFSKYVSSPDFANAVQQKLKFYIMSDGSFETFYGVDKRKVPKNIFEREIGSHVYFSPNPEAQ